MERKKISVEDYQEYFLGICMLLYLGKHLCPNLANANKELSKANDDANSAAFNELLHVIKYVLNTKNLGLKIEPTGNSNESWDIMCFNNTNYAGHSVSRRLMASYVMY